jgi:sialate O-acetylesterase
LSTFDVNEAKGFALCGEDKVWHWATGTLVGNNQVQVSSPAVSAPIAVRYAWAANPVCNLYATNGLPVTPFRSDNFPMITDPANVKAAVDPTRRQNPPRKARAEANKKGATKGKAP